MIHAWNPSSKSTGPRTIEGKARSSMNALKQGGRSRSFKTEISLLRKELNTFNANLIRFQVNNN
ncbi:MAG: hypothetical protein JSS07_06945 [Proteobacteria bacterium]|nr:hypothetical protein [Pseudomonadota bacterium]